MYSNVSNETDETIKKEILSKVGSDDVDLNDLQKTIDEFVYKYKKKKNIPIEDASNYSY